MIYQRYFSLWIKELTEYRASSLKSYSLLIVPFCPSDFIGFLHKWWVIFKEIIQGCDIKNIREILNRFKKRRVKFSTLPAEL